MNQTKIDAIIASIQELEDDERIQLLEQLKGLYCLKCGMEGEQRNCYCDYSTPLD